MNLSPSLLKFNVLTVLKRMLLISCLMRFVFLLAPFQMFEHRDKSLQIVQYVLPIVKDLLLRKNMV